MANVTITPSPKLQFNESGIPLSGGLLFTYAAGTSVKLTTYSDSLGTIPNANPIVLNSNGEANVYLIQGSGYKFTLSPANDTDPPTNSFWSVDNISTSNLSALTANPYAVAGGTSDAITATYTTASAILVDGFTLWLKITTPNATVNPSFAPTLNGTLQTTYPIVKTVANAEVALLAGDLQGDVTLIYNIATTSWRLLNPNTVPNATSATNSTNIVGSGTISATTTGGADLTPTNATNATNASFSTTQAVGNATTDIATTAFVNPSSGSNANGHWRKNPDGTIDQWGITTSVSTADGNAAITFPIAFPSAVESVTANATWTRGGTYASVASLNGPPTAAGASFTAWSSGFGNQIGLEVYWMAKGR